MRRPGLVALVVALVLLSGSRGRARPSHTPTRLSSVELAALARDVGFPEAEIAEAVRIALRESGGNPAAVNDTRGKAVPKGHKQEFSLGLWQINVLANPQFKKRNLLDARTNAETALEIWRKAGWAPWSTHS